MLAPALPPVGTVVQFADHSHVAVQLTDAVSAVIFLGIHQLCITPRHLQQAGGSIPGWQCARACHWLQGLPAPLCDGPQRLARPSGLVPAA